VIARANLLHEYHFTENVRRFTRITLHHYNIDVNCACVVSYNCIFVWGDTYKEVP
jgi:hypothetical protein